MNDLRNAPRLNDNIRIFSADDGNSLAMSLGTRGQPVEFQFDAGLLPKLIGKIFDGADQANKKRLLGDPTAGKPSELQSVAAQRPKNLAVGNSPGGEHVGVRLEISGIPFTLALTPDEARQLAGWLESAAAKQAEFSHKKPN